MQNSVSGRAVKQTLELKIVRADGRVEDLGIVGYWHKNPLKRAAWWLARKLIKLKG
jgi:hypothetical protein